MNQDKLQITRKDGTKVSVACFGRFFYEIGGQDFEFAVTQSINHAGKSVTHVASGLRACGLSVSATYLKAFAKAADDVERAKLALLELVRNVGAEKARSVLAAAQNAGRYRIYGRHQGQKKFRTMDINAGLQVANVRATLLTKEEVDKFMATEAPRNAEWQFEAREL